MKLTLMLGVLALVLVCIVNETSAHAGNTSMNTINDNGNKLTPKEQAEKRRLMILKKKQNRRDKVKSNTHIKRNKME